MWDDLLEDEQIRATVESVGIANERTTELRNYVTGAISQDDFENRVFLVRASIDEVVGAEMADSLILEWAKELS